MRRTCGIKMEMRNTYKVFGIRIYSYKILVGKPEGKMPLGDLCVDG
jgi:hypothetical protein